MAARACSTGASDMSVRNVLIAILAACGGGGVAPDASVADAAFDGAVDASEATRVWLTARTWDGAAAPDPTAVAIFRDPMEGVIVDTVVDSDGRASALMPDGGSVTVVQSWPDPTTFYRRLTRITTIRAVAPGDTLVAGNSRPVPTRSGDIEVMYASYTSINDAAGPYMFTACAEPGLGNPRSLVFYASCKTPTFDLLTIADDATTNVRKYVFLDDVAFEKDQTVIIPDTWQPLPHSAVTLANVPANRTAAGVRVFGQFDGVTLEVDSRFLQHPPAGSHAIEPWYPPMATPVLFVAANAQGIRLSETYALLTSTPATVTIDWATLPLPAVTNVRQLAAEVKWTQADPGTGDARVIVWTAQWLDGNGITHHAAWEVLEPADGPSTTTLSPLPAAHAWLDPLAASVQLQGGGVTYFDYEVLDGYAAVKARGTELTFVQQHVELEHRARALSVGSP
jgi:hypothetical protein